MVNALVAQCRKNGAEKVTVNAQSYAVGFYEKCGFRRISEQATYIDGSVNSHCCTLLWEK